MSSNPIFKDAWNRLTPEQKDDVKTYCLTVLQHSKNGILENVDGNLNNLRHKMTDDMKYACCEYMLRLTKFSLS